MSRPTFRACAATVSRGVGASSSSGKSILLHQERGQAYDLAAQRRNALAQSPFELVQRDRAALRGPCSNEVRDGLGLSGGSIFPCR